MRVPSTSTRMPLWRIFADNPYDDARGSAWRLDPTPGDGRLSVDDVRRGLATYEPPPGFSAGSQELAFEHMNKQAARLENAILEAQKRSWIGDVFRAWAGWRRARKQQNDLPGVL